MFPYNVIAPPKPSIQVLINGNAATGSTIINKRGQHIVVKIIPDPDFRNLLPYDAKYEIGKVSIFVKCGDEEPKKVGGAELLGRDAADGLSFPIPGEAFDCENGTVMYFVLSDIKRKNFQGKLFPDERFTAYEKEIHLLIEPKKKEAEILKD